jgi:hypothetical protein
MENENKNIKLCLEKLKKEELVEKLSTIINDYSVDVDKYFDVSEEVSTDVQEIFDYFNGFKIKKHTQINSKLLTLIKKALKTYGKENVKKYIRRYVRVINDKGYYYSYPWNLTEFLSRKEGIASFTDEGEKWLNYRLQRPIVDTDVYFDAIWAIYPNKQGKEFARKEFDKKFIHFNNQNDAKGYAQCIYIKLKYYIDNTDNEYIMGLGKWLMNEVANG